MISHLHPDGSECQHRRCKRRRQTRFTCDQDCGESVDVPALYARWDAEKLGWVFTDKGAHVCPHCVGQSWASRDARLPTVVQRELFDADGGPGA